MSKNAWEKYKNHKEATAMIIFIVAGLALAGSVVLQAADYMTSYRGVNMVVIENNMRLVWPKAEHVVMAGLPDILQTLIVYTLLMDDWKADVKEALSRNAFSLVVLAGAFCLDFWWDLTYKAANGVSMNQSTAQIVLVTIAAYSIGSNFLFSYSLGILVTVRRQALAEFSKAKWDGKVDRWKRRDQARDYKKQRREASQGVQTASPKNRGKNSGVVKMDMSAKPQR